jgi:hypothetical protein
MATPLLRKTEPKTVPKLVKCQSCRDTGIIEIEGTREQAFAGREEMPVLEYVAKCTMPCPNCAKGEALRPMIEAEQREWEGDEHGE